MVLSSVLATIILISVLDSGSLAKYSNTSSRWLFTTSSLKTIISNWAAYNCLGDSKTTLRKASWSEEDELL